MRILSLKIIGTATLLLAFNACKKDDDKATLLTKEEGQGYSAFYTYNAKGLLTKSDINFTNATTSDSEYFYDENDRLKEIVLTNELDGSQTKVILTYNSDNKVILYTDYALTSTGLSDWQTRHEYSYNGNTVTYRRIESGDSNNVFTRQTFTIDDHNNITNVKGYNRFGNLLQEELFSDFDDKHFYQKSLHFNISSAEKNNHRHYIRKDANGNILAEYDITYEYNKDGYPIKRVDKSPSGVTIETKYEYKAK